MRIISGVDGCSSGWVVVSKDLNGGSVSWRFAGSARDLADRETLPLVLAIDVPIGLLGSGARPCDLMAREFLGPVRGSSVFPAPIRPVLAAKNYTQACRLRQAVDGKKMSKQAWAIVPKIREVDSLLQERPDLRSVIREAHPEISFAHMGGGNPVDLPKRSWRGMARRIELLAPHFGEALEGALTARRELHAAPDDVLDAFAALWTAERLLGGIAVTLAGDPATDETGLPMEINA